ncbi:hypothetical protein M7775_13630 [Sporomusa sphaeroides DSM 2875]|uniref:hypothetical protein n=1 Tax=Sporomusa sphaeroides TaxID=47679 RepID=UPI0020308A19|nr:hypothetical protein [Sporomusa sphaeroides]MCM0759594.1 hypothetical protein [Sporomusa sphaeroides DSM 2875]
MELYDYLKPPQQPSALPPLPPPAQQSDLFATFGGYSYEDLYPYHPEDSRLWIELFVIADKINPDIAKRLEYIRTVGAVLIFDNQYGFRIEPMVDGQGVTGWSSIQQYVTERDAVLKPVGQQVMQALGELRQRYDQGRIR